MDPFDLIRKGIIYFYVSDLSTTFSSLFNFAGYLFLVFWGFFKVYFPPIFWSSYYLRSLKIDLLELRESRFALRLLDIAVKFYFDYAVYNYYVRILYYPVSVVCFENCLIL